VSSISLKSLLLINGCKSFCFGNSPLLTDSSPSLTGLLTYPGMS
jgi:hypothetical protein